MRARPICTIALIVLLAYAREAQADEPAPSTPNPSPTTLVQTEVERWLCVPGAPVERCIKLPPGRFVDEDSWQRIDREHRRLQEAETRLDAENKSYAASAAGWQPGWKTLAITFAVGLAAGAYAFDRLHD